MHVHKEEMVKQSVKSDTDGETGETKQDKDRTHMDEENSENWRIIAGRGQHSLSIYIFLNKVYGKMDSIRDASVDKTMYENEIPREDSMNIRGN